MHFTSRVRKKDSKSLFTTFESFKVTYVDATDREKKRAKNSNE